MRKSSFMFCLKFCHIVFFAHAYRLKTNSIFNEFHTSIFQIVQFLTCKIFRCVNFKCACSPILLIGSFGAHGFLFKSLKWPDNVEEARILLSIVFFWIFLILLQWLNNYRLKIAINFFLKNKMAIRRENQFSFFDLVFQYFFKEPIKLMNQFRYSFSVYVWCELSFTVYPVEFLLYDIIWLKIGGLISGSYMGSEALNRLNFPVCLSRQILIQFFSSSSGTLFGKFCFQESNTCEEIVCPPMKVDNKKQKKN